MKKSAVAAVAAALILLFADASAEDSGDPWEPIRFFEGKWTGTGEGKSGISTSEREYEFILGGNFMRISNRSVFKPQETNPKGEIHENLDIISYDTGRGKVILRQFHIEGFANTYVLESVSEDGKKLVFVTEQIENGPPGMSARLVLEKSGEDSFGESFELSMNDGEYTCLIKNIFQRTED
jgi:hypothetical protein